MQTFPEPWARHDTVFKEVVQTEINCGIPAIRPLITYTGTYINGFLGELTVHLEENGTKLMLSYGESGRFCLHPNGVNDEFRMEGLGVVNFVHKVAHFAPSDWMTVDFTFDGDNVSPISVDVSLFESSPTFHRK